MLDVHVYCQETINMYHSISTLDSAIISENGDELKWLLKEGGGHMIFRSKIYPLHTLLV